MIKNRTFMMGLGSGLVIGAVLLQLMWIGQGTAASETQELTKEQLMAAAEALDMQVVEGSDELMTAEQWEEKRLGESEEGDDPAQKTGTDKPEAPQQPEKPEAGVDKKQESTPKVTDPAKPKTPAKAEAPIKVNIPAGNNLSNVANSLLRAGVIDNKQAFINKATEKKINTMIQSGTYSFTAGESYNSIITKITAKPSN
ncbi:endolytic transglycosylase MltG [Paenibacillus sp. ISL-20]|uniref:endolytic transglycosylase MltG n=1 Tax=Paenibacillus sp. ISL-20 TaxID=2819163 RepID=UPI001BE59C79|nr:endolytic transglycosylase MltG [Paenibacillus sp. ISL-20]